MKLGELKLESLILISPQDELMVDGENDSDLSEKILSLRADSNYSDYLVAMPGAINRCFASLESKCLVPKKCYNVKSSDITRKGNALLIDLSAILDLCAIDKVLFYTEYQAPKRLSYSHMGKGILVNDVNDANLIVEYVPFVERVTNVTSDERVIELPPDVCDLIPYFVKSELLRAENENEAAVARNVFEAMAAELTDKSAGYQTKVESVYEVPI